MGLLTRECVNELRTAHDRVAGGLDNLERFLQTINKLVEQSRMASELITAAENTVREHTSQKEQLQQKMQDEAVLKEQLQKMIEEKAALKEQMQTQMQEIASLKEQIHKDQENAILKDQVKSLKEEMQKKDQVKSLKEQMQKHQENAILKESKKTTFFKRKMPSRKCKKMPS
ncbi:factor of DNA methylation 5-like [Triticum dicoccoides]|uniref:factor of DNA methylation 5-like n=1 Tax=Triticum dicoccoides TaxID=85692 RepID=UPI00188F28DE|nr:factor of DNA methylation 5-like [Triticum dicoccoides]XP_044337350.1 factor of DNA methylation 5-like [Triticum aestivum]